MSQFIYFLFFLSFITEEDDKLALLNLLAGYLSLLGEYISQLVSSADNLSNQVAPRPGLRNIRPEVIKLEFSLKLKIKCHDWLLVDMCLQAANVALYFEF